MSKFEDWSSHDGFNKWRISAGMVQLRKIEAAWEGYKAGVAAVNHSELAKENAALREALKPFAAYAAHYPLKRTFGNRPNTGEWHNVESGGIGRAQIDVEDFHRAAELLKEKP